MESYFVLLLEPYKEVDQNILFFIAHLSNWLYIVLKMGTYNEQIINYALTYFLGEHDISLCSPGQTCLELMIFLFQPLSSRIIAPCYKYC